MDALNLTCVPTTMSSLTLYPVYVHQQHGSAYGAILPDLPGVHSAADDLSQLPKMIREAVGLMYDGREAPPPPSMITAHLSQPRFQNGFWMLVDLQP